MTAVSAESRPQALASIQKLLSSGVVPQSSVPAIVQAVDARDNGATSEESVQLKRLQTLLTLLQSSVFPDSDEDLRLVLGLCFRMVESRRETESVHCTAFATVRQAVAVVFEHTSLSNLLGTAAAPAPQHQHSGTGPLPAGAPRAAYMLLQDLIMLSCDKPAEWMKLQRLPTVLVYELLEFILSRQEPGDRLDSCPRGPSPAPATPCRYPGYFLQVDMFRRALTEEVCGMLQQRLREPLGEEPSDVELAQRRLVLRMSATISRSMWPVSEVPTRAFVAAITRACMPDSPGWYQVQALQALRHVLGDPQAAYALYAGVGGSAKETPLLLQILAGLGEVFDTVVKLVAEPPADHLDPLTAISRTFSFHMRGRGKAEDTRAALLEPWAPTMLARPAAGLDLETETEPEIRMMVHGAVGTIECFLDLVGSLDRMAAHVLDPTAATAAAAARGDHATPPQPLDRARVEALLLSVWERVLSVLSYLMGHAIGEDLVVATLQAYQKLLEASPL